MTVTTSTDIDELRAEVKAFIEHEKNRRNASDKTSLINYCTATLIYFTESGFSREQIRAEVVSQICG